MINIESLKSARAHPNVIAFLRVIRAGEGTQGEQGYRTLFGGGLFDSFDQHPNRQITAVLAGRPIASTAAGAYQFLSRTWQGLVKQYGFSDFSPPNQDLGAIALIAGRNALHDVLAGNFEAAVRKCNREWASLPESPYGQPTLTWARALAIWAQERSALAQQNVLPTTVGLPKQKEPEMPLPALVLAMMPQLIASLPSLAKIMSRSEGETVPERNVKLAEKVGDLITQATGQDTVEGAVRAIQADPGMAQRADTLIASNFAELMDLLKFEEESRGKARDFAARMLEVETPTAKLWKAIGFGVLLSILALGTVGGGGWILYSVLADLNTPPEQKGMIVGAIVTAVTSVLSYFFGSSASSRSKDQAIIERAR